MRIGVAVAKKPNGPFRARPKPITGSEFIDPNVLKLPNGKWVLFTSAAEIYVQPIDSNFMQVGEKIRIRGLRKGYKEGPFAELRNGNLILHYAYSVGGRYKLMQAMARDRNNPGKGCIYNNLAVGDFHHETNHGSVVTYKGRSWAFYHRHLNTFSGKWKYRRAVFSPVTFLRNGEQRTIYPNF